MKVICVEGVANHDSPESCVVAGDRKGEALTGGGVGPVWSRESHEPLQEAETVENERRPRLTQRYREVRRAPARSETRCMHPITSCGSREIPRRARPDGGRVRQGNLLRGYRR